MLINAWKVPPTAQPWILWPRKAHTALFTPMDADINTHKASGPSVVCWQCLCLCTWMSFIEWGSIKAEPRKSRALQCLSPLILQHTPPEEHTHWAWYASQQHIYCSSNLFVSVILFFSYTPNKGLKLLLIHRLLSGALRQTVSSLCWQTLPFNHLGLASALICSPTASTQVSDCGRGYGITQLIESQSWLWRPANKPAQANHSCSLHHGAWRFFDKSGRVLC